MGFYRCMNQYCSTNPHGLPGFDFEAEAPVCPKCQSDARHPRFAHLIQTLELVHFDPPHPRVFGMGQGILACKPTLEYWKPQRSRNAAMHVSGVRAAVTCPDCKKSPAFLGPDPEPTEGIPPVGDLRRGPPMESIPESARDVVLGVEQTDKGPVLRAQ